MFIFFDLFLFFPFTFNPIGHNANKALLKVLVVLEFNTTVTVEYNVFIVYYLSLLI